MDFVRDNLPASSIDGELSGTNDEVYRVAVMKCATENNDKTTYILFMNVAIKRNEGNFLKINVKYVELDPEFYGVNKKYVVIKEITEEQAKEFERLYNKYKDDIVKFYDKLKKLNKKPQ